MPLVSNHISLEECHRKLILSIQQHNPTEREYNQLKKAIVLAEQAHKGQFRKSGIPYIIHPLRLALLASEYALDMESLIVCLLHDVIEDSTTDPKIIEKEFGSTVFQMVEALTKVKSSKNLTWFKIIQGGMIDIRIILVKLLDRVDNLLEINALPRYKQRIVCNETIHLYSEIAYGLGVIEIADELSARSYACLFPRIYQSIESRLKVMRETSEAFVFRIVNMTKKVFPSDLIGYITPRYAKVNEIFAKEEYKNVQQSFKGLVIHVKEVSDCYKTLGLLHSCFLAIPLSLRDYISNPMANGWRGLVTQVIIDGVPVVVYILTSSFANANRRGVLALMQEEIYNPKLYQNFLGVYFETLHDTGSYNDLRIEDIFLRNKQNVIQVFTEKGDSKEFRYGSTILDFAFSIHTEIGLQCVGATVNSIFYSYDKLLEEGMVITVETSEKVYPTQTWLDIAVMPKTRKEILQYLVRTGQKSKNKK